MINSINWNNIRTFNKSQNDGFEELVCQLANREIIPDKVKFWRVGKPDGGKECFWLLKNGELYAWQAKYFLTSLTTGQWTQIEKSVKNAIDNHQNLSKYYISFPLDMPDTKVKGKKSMLDKWNEFVSKWEKYGVSKGINVKFEFWGSFKLTERLIKRENEGLKYFWFNQLEFTDEWFDFRNKESINALGNRYSADLNFELPIAKIFDGFSRDKSFENQVHFHFKQVIEKYKNHWNYNQTDDIKSLFKELTNKVKNLRLYYKQLPFVSNEKLQVQDLIEHLKDVYDCGDKLLSHFYKLREDKEAGKIDYHFRPYASEISDISNFISAVYDFMAFINSPTFRLANNPFLILTGAWGRGKSHLIADIVKHRKNKGEQSLLLLGENFTTKDSPWTQILYNQLRKNGIDEFVLLGALNAKAESLQSRIIIFIDALNEGEGRFVWPKKLKSFFESFENYPWLGVVVSIRDSFVPLIAPESDFDEKISFVEHQGFEGLEYFASKYFFEHYKIIQPKIPLLNPEFQTPLFLKLFCLSIRNRNLHEIPKGYIGLTMILNDYLESIELKLSRPEELYYDINKKLVKKSIEKILSKLIEKKEDFLTYEEASEIVDSIFIGNSYNPQPFLEKLISEGLFNKNLHWGNNNTNYYVIYFSYQRFQDHLTISMLLDMYLDVNEPEKSFKSGKLWELTKDNQASHYNQNLVEAISIQLPERTQKEFYEVAPYAKLFYSTANAFIDSLMWRRIDSVNDGAKNYVNEIILNNENLFDRFLDIMISTSMIPGYYFNAERLHNYLQRFSLPERDKIWTIWLQNKYGENSQINSVKRLVDWAWEEEDKSHISDDSVLLGAITISWFLTSANRYLRDSATKALVSLLQNRTHLLIPLLKKFSTVNDPYVIERLYAVAYGCVLRAETTKDLNELSNFIYAEIFNQETVYPHILLRDYAREIIEFTVLKGIKLSIDLTKVRPPYKSEPVPSKFPSNKEIDTKYEPKDKDGHYGGKEWGNTAILRSMTTEYGRGGGYGDFGRYVFQSALSDWKVNYDGLSNYAIERIFEIGYNSELFGDFDSEQGSGRGSGHKERIGKKYQWIVFYEILAKVSDQKKLLDESSWGSDKKVIEYDGPWYPYVRDIDPSVLIRTTKSERYIAEFSKHWWFNTDYSDWEKLNKDWINSFKDLPDPCSIIEKEDPAGEKWLWLEIHPEWFEPVGIDEEKWYSNKKRIWYHTRCYIIHKRDLLTFENQFKQNGFEIEYPDSRSIYKIFSREYYWSPAFEFQNKPYYNGKIWIDVYNEKKGNQIAEVTRTTEFFNWEEEFDCSKENNIGYYKPTHLLFDGLKMKTTKREGELIDENGNLICFDPSVNNKSISGLLIKKKPLIDFLESNGFILIWDIIGEKQVINNGNFKEEEYPGRLNIYGLFTLNNGLISGKLKFKKE